MKDFLVRIYEKYSNLSAPVKASMWFTVCNIVQKGISFLTTPIFTRLLTTEQYGEFTLYSSWYQIISIFATLNLFYGVYNNGMTKYSDSRKQFTSSIQGLSTTVTIILFLIYIVSYEFWNELIGLSTLYMVAMFIELLFVPAYNFWSAGQRYDYKYKSLIAVSLFIAIGSPLLGIIAVINTEYKAEARILTLVVIQILVGAIFYIYNLKEGKRVFDKFYWKYALCFNLPLIPHYLSSIILGHSDRIMIANMVGKSEAALYGVAYNVALMMNIVTSAINNSFTPYMYKELKKENYEGIKKNSNLLIMFVGIISLITITLGPEIIMIIASPEYKDAMWVIPPIAASIYFMFLYPIFSNVEFYFDKTIYIMVASCFGAVLNIGLNYILLPNFGYYVAGYTTLFCYMIYAFAHYFFASYLSRKEKISGKLFDNKVICMISVALIVAMGGLLILYNYTLLRVFAGILEVIIGIYLIKKWMRESK